MADIPNPFQIDAANLHLEWIKQPQMSMEAGRREADARHELNQANANLSVIAARMAQAIRRAPEKFGLDERPTVDAVRGAVELTPEYQAAVQTVSNAELAVAYAKAETNAYVDRRKALENLVELLRLDYYSEQEAKPITSQSREYLEQRRRSRRDGGCVSD